MSEKNVFLINHNSIPVHTSLPQIRSGMQEWVQRERSKEKSKKKGLKTNCPMEKEERTVNYTHERRPRKQQEPWYPWHSEEEKNRMSFRPRSHSQTVSSRSTTRPSFFPLPSLRYSQSLLFFSPTISGMILNTLLPRLIHKILTTHSAVLIQPQRDSRDN